MGRTVIGVGDAKAVKKYSAFLAVDVGKKSYFNRKMMGVGIEAETPLQTLPHLENDSGDQIGFDLVMALRMKPVQGDNTLRGKEEDLKFYSDSVYIDQLRGGVNTGGKMTRKRTIHNLRKIARARQSDWWSRLFDETFFMYLSGARGVATDFIEDTDFTGYAGNSFATPDTAHRAYGGDATSYATIDSGDKLTLTAIDKLVTKANTMGGGTTGIPRIQPCMVDGEERYVLLMHPFQEYDLRTSSSTGQWMDIQKAAAAAEGRDNPLFKGGLGLYNNVILHTHRNVVRFSDAGSGSNVAAARALFMGRQAGVVAFGSPGTDLRFDWNEETEDRGNQVVITTSSIFGVKKTRFSIDGTSYDFGVIAVDTAAADPT